MENKAVILWVDDEIDLLKSNILFLKQKGYDVYEATNGDDAIQFIKNNDVDLVFMDEMMPGKGGLETLSEVKDLKPGLPVVMVTKNEEESLMEDAIGKKISDYLLKPVNPKQVLLVCKKFLEGRKLKGDQVSRDYIQEFNQISMSLMNELTWDEWINIHVKMTNWELELDEHPELGLKQTAIDQRRECNVEFSKFVEKNYRNWLDDNAGAPVLSNRVVDNTSYPILTNTNPCS